MRAGGGSPLRDNSTRVAAGDFGAGKFAAGRRKAGDFAEAARNQYPGLRVLMTSGYSEDLLANGTRGFPLLQKPYRMRDLTDAIGRVWEGRPGK